MFKYEHHVRLKMDYNVLLEDLGRTQNMKFSADSPNKRTTESSGLVCHTELVARGTKRKVGYDLGFV